MSRKLNLRNTIAYTMGFDVALRGTPDAVLSCPYRDGINSDAWRLGVEEGLADRAYRNANPDKHFASLVRSVRDGDNEATAEALELLWEKMK